MTTQLGYDYDKHRSALRHWLLGKEYYKAHKAMDFAMSYHTGFRKDGTTPEFFHQVFQANFARSLAPSLLHPEDVLTTIFLHDVVEDYDVMIDLIKSLFGSVGNSVDLMDAKSSHRPSSSSEYYGSIAEDVNASVAKGIDRLHNIQSMVGVFTLEKQASYMEETERHVLPMLKTARKKFPEQDSAYQNIKHVLLTQIELIKAYTNV